MVYLFQLVAVFFLLLSITSPSVAYQPTVFVSILPQKFFVQQISGDRVVVEVMVQPGASPATYEPKASQMKKLSTAKVYFANGVPFEKSWLEKIAGVNKDMLIVHTDEGIRKLKMIEHEHHESHGSKGIGEHDGEDFGVDPHIWLSPALVKKQVTIMAQTLTDLLPEFAQIFEQNLHHFLQKIETLDADLRSNLASKSGKSFMVFHPSWGYFANDYDLKQVAVEIEGKNPKPAQLRELIERARKDAIRIVFAQPQFSKKNANLIAREIKGEVITLDPLAENWLENMKAVSEKLKKSIND